MKKKILLAILIQACFLLASAQGDFEKMMGEFEKMMKDPKNIYGNNKTTGKYYHIRGIKMYTEVYGQGQPVLFIHGNGGAGNNFLNRFLTFQKSIE